MLNTCILIHLCTVDIPECDDNSCSGSGMCTERIGGGVNCCCDEGFSGTDCSIASDHCASTPCLNGGTCVSDKDGFQCTCTRWYTGITCGIGKC